MCHFLQQRHRAVLQVQRLQIRQIGLHTGIQSAVVGRRRQHQMAAAETFRDQLGYIGPETSYIAMLRTPFSASRPASTLAAFSVLPYRVA